MLLQRLLSVLLSIALAYVAWLFVGMLFTGQTRLVVGIIAAVACVSGGGFLSLRNL